MYAGMYVSNLLRSTVIDTPKDRVFLILFNSQKGLSKLLCREGREL